MGTLSDTAPNRDYAACERGQARLIKRFVLVAKPASIQTIKSACTVTRAEPRNIVSGDECLFAHEYTKTFDATYYAVYKNARVSYKGSAVRGIIPSAIPESVHHDYMSVAVRIKSAARGILHPAAVRVERALLVTDHVSGGYFHWIADVLPKVLLITRRDPRLFDTMPILLPSQYNKPYCLQTLRLLGILPERVIIIPRGRSVVVGTLYAVGDIVSPHGSGNYRPELMQLMRSAITTAAVNIKPNIGTHRRVYISRADAGYRHVVNELELKPVLERMGFNIVVIGAMDFAEQVQLCAGADVLVSAHGAGLTNMMWMNAGATVGEIRRAGDAHNNCYFSLASALNLNYWYSTARADSGNTQRADFTWDVSAAEYFLEQVIHDTRA